MKLTCKTCGVPRRFDPICSICRLKYIKTLPLSAAERVKEERERKDKIEY